jgi:hypothetical protein
VLIEVPVMLSVVEIVNASRDWYDAGAAVRGRTAPVRALRSGTLFRSVGLLQVKVPRPAHVRKPVLLQVPTTWCVATNGQEDPVPDIGCSLRILDVHHPPVGRSITQLVLGRALTIFGSRHESYCHFSRANP